MERLIRNAPILLLAGALAASAALTLTLTWDFTFLQDTWEFLINRRETTLDTVLAPHNEHIVAIPVLSEQLFLRAFGMTSARPEYILMTIGLLVTAVLFFIYVRRRVGPWPALFATTLILFLGPAWETLFWPFEICFIGSVLFGISMLLALERNDRLGDVAACICLVVAIGFSSLGLVFAAGALVAIFQGPRRLAASRICVLVVPVVLYAVWYLGWGHEADNHLTLQNILLSPRFVLEGVAFTVGSMVGLGPNAFAATTAPAWGSTLLVVLIAALCYRQWRKPGFSPDLWPVAAIFAAYWLLAAFNQMPGREPTASRYQYAGTILLLMVLANFFRGERFTRRVLMVGAAVTVAAIGLNLVALKNGRNTFRDVNYLVRADTAAIEIARQTVAPDFQLTPEVAGTGTLIDISAGPYFTAVDEYGSPAYSLEELVAAPGMARRQADIVLAHALPVSTVTLLDSKGRAGGGNCTALPVGDEKPEVRLAPGTTRIYLAPGPPAAFSLRRFAEGEYPVLTEGAPGGSLTRFHIPRDEASQSWFLNLEAAQHALVCR
jgi:hypothetical protein